MVSPRNQKTTDNDSSANGTSVPSSSMPRSYRERLRLFEQARTSEGRKRTTPAPQSKPVAATASSPAPKRQRAMQAESLQTGSSTAVSNDIFAVPSSSTRGEKARRTENNGTLAVNGSAPSGIIRQENRRSARLASATPIRDVSTSSSSVPRNNPRPKTPEIITLSSDEESSAPDLMPPPSQVNPRKPQQTITASRTETGAGIPRDQPAATHRQAPIAKERVASAIVSAPTTADQETEDIFEDKTDSNQQGPSYSSSSRPQTSNDVSPRNNAQENLQSPRVTQDVSTQTNVETATKQETGEESASDTISTSQPRSRNRSAPIQTARDFVSPPQIQNRRNLNRRKAVTRRKAETGPVSYDSDDTEPSSFPRLAVVKQGDPGYLGDNENTPEPSHRPEREGPNLTNPDIAVNSRPKQFKLPRFRLLSLLEKTFQEAWKKKQFELTLKTKICLMYHGCTQEQISVYMEQRKAGEEAAIDASYPRIDNPKILAQLEEWPKSFMKYTEAEEMSKTIDLPVVDIMRWFTNKGYVRQLEDRMLPHNRRLRLCCKSATLIKTRLGLSAKEAKALQELAVRPCPPVELELEVLTADYDGTKIEKQELENYIKNERSEEVDDRAVLSRAVLNADRMKKIDEFLDKKPKNVRDYLDATKHLDYPTQTLIAYRRIVLEEEELRKKKEEEDRRVEEEKRRMEDEAQIEQERGRQDEEDRPEEQEMMGDEHGGPLQFERWSTWSNEQVVTWAETFCDNNRADLQRIRKSGLDGPGLKKLKINDAHFKNLKLSKGLNDLIVEKLKELLRKLGSNSN